MREMCLLTRSGKIARLPRDVRERLNGRLQQGQPGKGLVAWLLGLAEVKRGQAAEFGGRANREQNLSDWKPGGEQIAACLVEIKEELPRGIVSKGGPSSPVNDKQFGSTAIKANQTKSSLIKPDLTQAGPIKPDQARSRSIKPDQASEPGG